MPTLAICCPLLLLNLVVVLSFLAQVAQHSDREALYKELVESPGVIWATAEVGSRRIDEINILEATKEAMTVSHLVPYRSPFLLLPLLFVSTLISGFALLSLGRLV